MMNKASGSFPLSLGLWWLYAYKYLSKAMGCHSSTEALEQQLTRGYKVLIISLCSGKMIRVLSLAAVVATFALVSGQAQKGRILEPPVPALCAQRKIHERFGGKGYFFSWKEPSTAGQEKDWLDGRNYCRQRCMDLVSPDSKPENDFIKSRIVRDKVKYIWTSGRLCDFKGCDRPDLKPLNVNGWFWTAELKKLPPTTDRINNDWSPSGGLGRPQPDNREAAQGGATENCLAILNQFYKDGVNWHDVACHHFKPWVCEENQSLLSYVRATNPTLRI
ncbi:uncharacterized protein LOC132205534 [Neocloeon triangulifer]|uniref:uncharacterized protein LOC132205534 n=1 Tax=Neocloeon triangulifer TaxID=2078957 RepID=UPI00286F9D89|nr:uncharacterized protein LOC132205534 [Neocloeon triangulifer]